MNLGILYALGAAITWGAVYTLDQTILASTAPFVLLFVDAVLTAILLVPFVLRSRASVGTTASLGELGILRIIASVFLATVANYLIFSSIRSIGASVASIIEIGYPFFVVLFSIAFFHTRPHVGLLAGGALIFAGAAIVVWSR